MPIFPRHPCDHPAHPGKVMTGIQGHNRGKKMTKYGYRYPDEKEQPKRPVKKYQPCSCGGIKKIFYSNGVVECECGKPLKVKR